MKKFLIALLLLTGCSIQIRNTETETVKYNPEMVEQAKKYCKGNMNVSYEECMRLWGINESP